MIFAAKRTILAIATTLATTPLLADEAALRALIGTPLPPEALAETPATVTLPLELRLRVLGQLLEVAKAPDATPRDINAALEAMADLDPDGALIPLDIRAALAADAPPAPAMPAADSEIASLIAANDAPALIAALLQANAAPQDDAITQQALDMILAYIRPLSSTRRQANRDGYAALLILAPDTAQYAAKVAQYEQAIAAHRSNLVSSMRTSRDDFRQITWYKHPSRPRFANTRSYFQIYIGLKDDGTLIPRLLVHYTNDGWLFIDRADFLVDGEMFRPSGMSGRWDRDNGAGDIWEWMDVPLTGAARDLARAVANSDSARIRFNGSQYYNDHTITDRDKVALRDMFLLEEILRADR